MKPLRSPNRPKTPQKRYKALPIPPLGLSSCPNCEGWGFIGKRPHSSPNVVPGDWCQMCRGVGVVDVSKLGAES